MPHVELKDGLGIPVPLHEFNGKYFPRFPVIEDSLKHLPDMPCRDDDVLILTYPKAGTNWIWEIVNMLYVGDGGTSVRNRLEGMMELTDIDTMTALPSVRLLLTHLTPELCPKDLFNRNCKIIFVQRNPKDSYVSFFHFIRKLKLYNYDGEWNGFFELIMNRKNAYGSWFDFTKQWEDFLTQHPDIPVLRLYFENMKLDLPSEIERTAQFLDLPCIPSYRDKVAERCGFDVMKTWHKFPKEVLLNPKSCDDSSPVLRKGIIGDWKNHFTVAQNERFDAEYKKEMKGFTFKFEQYI